MYNDSKAEANLDAVMREARRTFGVLNEFKTRLFMGSTKKARMTASTSKHVEFGAI